MNRRMSGSNRTSVSRRMSAHKWRMSGSKWKCAALLLVFLFCLSSCDGGFPLEGESQWNTGAASGAQDGRNAGSVSGEESGQESEWIADADKIQNAHNLSDVPAFSGDPYAPVNDNIPGFTYDNLTSESFETYSDLDALGRCGVAYANVGTDLMPTEARGSIGQVKPSGWNSAKYDIVDGKYLYNRCHLIGYQLTAENANRQNLITGTRYLNVKGMLPFENLVADYVKETDYHVLYRVTPVFDGDNLVASGVQMEAMSVEDRGDGVLFNVYCYNVQPGIAIDYATGESWEAADVETAAYVLNTNTRKFHLPSCSVAERISDAYRAEYTGSREELIAQGYEACQRCKP